MDALVTSTSFINTDMLTKRLEMIQQSLQYRARELVNITCWLYDIRAGVLNNFSHSQLKNNHTCTLESMPLLHELQQNHHSKLVSALRNKDEFYHLNKMCQTKNKLAVFVVPMFSDENFYGFLFFEALDETVITDVIQRDMELHTQLITMTVASELNMLKTLMATVKVAADFTDLRDFETGLHLERMAIYARLIAKQLMTSHQLTERFVDHLYVYARLHDIGKIGIPDHILMKEDRLDEHERTIIESHVEKGVTILKNVLEQYQLSELPDSQMMLNIVACHHEYLDGSGYPKQLTAEQIPIEARIVTVADIFDALTSRRPYKRIWSVDEAINELERMQQQHKLDADCVAALSMNVEALKQIVVNFADEQREKEA